MRDAGTKSVDELAGEIADLADRARSGSLAADELRDSTFTVTSAGKLAGLFQTPIVNYPEVAILSVGRAGAAGGARRSGRRAADGDDRNHVRPRVIDARAAAFGLPSWADRDHRAVGPPG